MMMKCFRASKYLGGVHMLEDSCVCVSLDCTGVFVGSGVALWLKAESYFQPDKPGFESCLLPDTLYIHRGKVPLGSRFSICKNVTNSQSLPHEMVMELNEIIHAIS